MVYVYVYIYINIFIYITYYILIILETKGPQKLFGNPTGRPLRARRLSHQQIQQRRRMGNQWQETGLLQSIQVHPLRLNKAHCQCLHNFLGLAKSSHFPPLDLVLGGTLKNGMADRCQEQWRQDAMSLARLVSRLHVEMDSTPGTFGFHTSHHGKGLVLGQRSSDGAVLGEVWFGE